MASQSKFQEMTRSVEANLDYMRRCERTVAQAETALMNAREDLATAETEFNESKQALFREFPEMAPTQTTQALVQAEPEHPTPPPAEPIPVMTPQGPVVFREMDDSPFPDS
jgi:hypothetical protein